MALNREGHRQHRMPLLATRERRINWHIAHATVCACRSISDSIKPDVEKLPKLRGKT
jgi:hypothetical protein